MSNAAQTPDIEFNRKQKDGSVRSYGHIYWRPFIVHILGRTIIGKKHLS